MVSPETIGYDKRVHKSSLENSPLAMKKFLDALAELIACAILEESAPENDEDTEARRATSAAP